LFTRLKTFAEYDSWRKDKLALKTEFAEWEPVGFFELDEKSESVTVDLDVRRVT